MNLNIIKNRCDLVGKLKQLFRPDLKNTFVIETDNIYKLYMYIQQQQALLIQKIHIHYVERI